MTELITILILALLLIAQAIERYLFSRTMTEQLNRYMIANISKNVNEFNTATMTQKITTEIKPPDEIPLDEVDDDTFGKIITNQIKK